MSAYRILSTAGLVKLMNMPHLETLASYTDPSVNAPIVGTLRPKLRTLAIGSFRYTPVIEQILQSFNTPLEQFVLVIDALGEDDIVSFKNGLRHRALFLRRLALIGKPFYELPFMDDYTLSFPSLETLHCSDLLYTPSHIYRLPRTPKSLILRAPAG